MFFNRWKQAARIFRRSGATRVGRSVAAGRRRLRFEPLESRQLLSLATTIPVTASGYITLQEIRTPYDSTYDEIDIKLTGMKVSGAKIVDIDGTFTAVGGAFYMTGSFATDILNGYANSAPTPPAPPESYVNFDSLLTNNGRTQATPPVANQYTSFSILLYDSPVVTTSRYLTFPEPAGSNGFDNTLLATMFVTKSTTSVAFSGDMGFTDTGGGSAGNPTVNFPDTAPEKPTNVSPADGASSLGLAPTVVGSAYAAASGGVQTGAEFQVATNANFSNVVWDDTLSTAANGDTVPAGTLSGGTYYWRVRYQDASGFGEWSNATGFTTGAVQGHLVVTTQPTSAVAGAAISPAVQVSVEDANGNVVTSDNSSVTIAIGANPGNGTLSGTLTVAAVNGVATFNGLSINKAGTGYTLTATDGSLTGATSSTFNITPGRGCSGRLHDATDQRGGGGRHFAGGAGVGGRCQR